MATMPDAMVEPDRESTQPTGLSKNLDKHLLNHLRMLVNRLVNPYVCVANAGLRGSQTLHCEVFVL